MRELQEPLKALMAGEFICPIAFPSAYRILESEAAQEEARQWLGNVGLELSRVGEDGPFFASYARADAEARSRVREDFKRFRDKHEPAIRLLDAIRQAAGPSTMLAPGELLVASKLTTSINESTALARLLDEVTRLISGAKTTHTYAERVRRLLEHLEREGYLKRTDAPTETFVVTGKVSYLYELLQFLETLAPEVRGKDDDEQAQQELA
jgi:hypothetical protein